jgi:hypothetical protein
MMEKKPPSAAEPSSGPSLPRLPVHKPGSFLSRDEANQTLQDAGVLPKTLVSIRLPGRVMAGYKPVEFFDVLSEQPFPGTPEDLPSHCAVNGLSAPKWITERYVSVDDGKITFVDVPRKVCIKIDLSDQDALAREVSHAIVEKR